MTALPNAYAAVRATALSYAASSATALSCCGPIGPADRAAVRRVVAGRYLTLALVKPSDDEQVLLTQDDNENDEEADDLV